MDIDFANLEGKFDYFEQFSKEHLKILSVFGNSVKKSDSIDETIDIANKILWQGLHSFYSGDIKSEIYLFRRNCMQNCQSVFRPGLENILRNREYLFSDGGKIFIPIRYRINGFDSSDLKDEDPLLGTIVVSDSKKLDLINREFLVEYSKRVGVAIYRNILVRMLEMRNSEMSEFCAQVGHDLNNHVTGIRGFSEIIKDKISSSEYNSLTITKEDLEILNTCANNIYSNTLKIEDIIDLLALEEINPNIVKNGSKFFNLYDFMRESFLTHIANIYQKDTLEDRCNFILSVDKEFVSRNVKFDPKFLTIIFDNLIGNATKYTPNSGVILSSIYNQGDNINFDFLNSLKESISCEELSELGKKGNRASSYESKNRDFGLNYGLGLYMIEKFVRKGMLGKISLSSNSSLDISKALDRNLKEVYFFGDYININPNIGNYFRVEISIPREFMS